MWHVIRTAMLEDSSSKVDRNEPGVAANSREVKALNQPRSSSSRLGEGQF